MSSARRTLMNEGELATSGVRAGDGSRRHSLRWRLPLAICGLFLVALVVVVYAAYREVEATLERGAGDRAHQAAQQVAGIFAPSTAQSLAQLRRVAPDLREYLEDPTDARRDAARAALAVLPPAPNRRITVWDA